MAERIDCDLRTPEGEPCPYEASWAIIGEAGDFYICDWHHSQVRPDARDDWRPVP